MKTLLLLLPCLFFSFAVSAQTETTDFIQEPAISATEEYDSIWARAAGKKVKTVAYHDNDSDKDSLQLVAFASFSNTGKLMYTNFPFKTEFKRSHYTYYSDGYKVLTVKGDEERIADGYKVKIIEATFDLKGHPLTYGEASSNFDADTLVAEGGSGWIIQMKGDLPAEKYDSKTDETEYYTYDSHGYITEIKRARDFDTELYRRIYDGDKLIESYFMRGGHGGDHKLFEKFEYNNQGLVSKSISDITPTYEGLVTSYDYNDAGQLIKSVNKYGTKLFTYDSAGRLIKAEKPFMENVRITNYSYNAQGLLILAEEASLAKPENIFRQTYTYTYW